MPDDYPVLPDRSCPSGSLAESFVTEELQRLKVDLFALSVVRDLVVAQLLEVVSSITYQTTLMVIISRR